MKIVGEDVYLDDSEFEQLWQTVQFLQKFPNVLIGLNIPGRGSWHSQFTKKELLMALSDSKTIG